MNLLVYMGMLTPLFKPSKVTTQFYSLKDSVWEFQFFKPPHPSYLIICILFTVKCYFIFLFPLHLSSD